MIYLKVEILREPDGGKSEKKPCDCYNPIYARCYGAKEFGECSCGGDESKCDFYEYKRRKANETRTGKAADDE